MKGYNEPKQDETQVSKSAPVRIQSYDERLLEQRIEMLQGDIRLWRFLSVVFFFCFVTAMFYILFTRVI